MSSLSGDPGLFCKKAKKRTKTNFLDLKTVKMRRDSNVFGIITIRSSILFLDLKFFLPNIGYYMWNKSNMFYELRKKLF